MGPEPGRAGRLGRAARGHRDRRRHRARSTHEYLYWVGCAGSFDDKNKKVTAGHRQAAAAGRHRLRHPRARPRTCTGDPARRSGNEYLFQMLATQNVETLDGMGVQEDRHPVPALLQHPEERVPAARRQLRGGAPQPVPRVPDRERPARPVRGPARGAGRVPRLAATWAATTTSTWPPARSSARLARHRDRRGRAATAPRACAAGPGAPACGWRSPPASKVNVDRSQELHRPPAPAASPPPARSATS